MSVSSHSRVAARLEKAHDADRIGERGDDVADAVVLELLRRRALQVDVVALALAEGRDHLLGGAGVDQR